MPFPDEIETGINAAQEARLGKAGPTGDLGHLPAHDATGLPSLLVDIQTSIGVLRAVKSFTPTFTGASRQPDLIDCEWAQYGPVVWVDVYASWGTAAVSGSGQLSITGTPLPQPRGAGPMFHGLYNSPTFPNRIMQCLFAGGAISLKRTDANTQFQDIGLIEPNSQLRFNGTYFTT